MDEHKQMDQRKNMTWTWPVALCASAEAVNSNGSLWKDDVVWDGLEKHEGEALCTTTYSFLITPTLKTWSSS